MKNSKSGIDQEGPCRIHPLLFSRPNIVIKWKDKDIREFIKAFPDNLQSFCIFAFFMAGKEIGQIWAGATFEYFDEVIKCMLENLCDSWKYGLRAPDYGPLSEPSLIALIRQNYVRREDDVYYPTEKLISKLAAEDD